MSGERKPIALVVDDDAVVRRLVRRSLESFQMCREVIEATDGYAAQEILGERTGIELVLTDIMMPGLDGLDLLRWGREHVPDAVWIILSGLDTFSTAVEAIRLGAFDFLAKPLHVEELEVAVRNALEQRRLHRERDRLHGELQAANARLRNQVRELEEKSALLRRDLERAEVIQRALLPQTPPPIERYCVQAVYRPGQHVGGDLYDVIALDDRYLALYVADATGHGVTSAMLSVLFKQQLVVRDGLTGVPLAPAVVLEAVNRALVDAVAAPGLFLTAAYCLVDSVEGTVRIASAGHPPLFHVRERVVREIRRTGPALGLAADAHYAEEQVRLAPGDRLLLYTDGILQCIGGAEAERLPEALGLVGARVAAGPEEFRHFAETAASGDDRDDTTLLLLEVRAGASRFDNGAPVLRSAAGARDHPLADAKLLYGETESASWLALRGRATWTRCEPLHATASAVLEEGHPLVLDLSECEYLDSTCLGTVHELVTSGEVRVHDPPPSVRALFEELSMDRVLSAIGTEPSVPGEFYPLAVVPADARAGRMRVLHAHETLASLNEANRARFAGVVDALRGEPEPG